MVYPFENGGTLLILKSIKEAFSICQVADYLQVHFESDFFLGRTDKEKFLVCLSKDIPANAIQVDRG